MSPAGTCENDDGSGDLNTRLLTPVSDRPSLVLSSGFGFFDPAAVAE